MKNLLKKAFNLLSRGIQSLEDHPATLGMWLSSVIGLVTVRILAESWLSSFGIISAQAVFSQATHFFLSLLLTVLLFIPLVKWAGKTSVPSAATIVLFGFLIVVTPPLVDALIAGGGKLWNFYKFDGLSGWSDSHGLPYRFLTFFGDRPDMGVTYGVRLEIAISTVFLGLYAFIKSSSWRRALATSFFAYALFFFLGTLPSWIAIVVDGFRQGFLAVSDVDIARIFLTPEAIFSQTAPDFVSTLNVKMSLVSSILLFGVIGVETFLFFPKIFKNLFRNSRLPQSFYHGGLLCAGMGLAVVFSGGSVSPTFFNIMAFVAMMGAVWSAWLASVVVNDVFDARIDAVTNAWRPVPSKSIDPATYRTIGWIFFGASLILGGVADFKSTPYLFAYQALAWLYSAPPLRLKRIPILGTFMGAVAGLLILFIGFTFVSPDGTIDDLPIRITVFLLISLTFILSAKDFRDIEGDHADGVYTIPVVLGEEWARIAIGAGIWLSYLSSMLIFHEFRLFFPSLFFGAVSFWLVLIAKNKQKGRVTFRSLPGWLFILATFYAAFIEWIVIF